MSYKPPRNRHKSLFITVGASIVFTVVIIMSMHSTYTYFYEKHQIVKNIKKNVNTTVTSLEKNIEPFMEAYAVNEYENLIANEIEDTKSFAIIVYDYNMGKVLGKKSYITGKIRDENNNIADYNQKNAEAKKRLEECFYRKTAPIMTTEKKIGEITVCMSDERVQQRKASIIKNTISDALIISISLLIAILFILHRYVFRPISRMAASLENRDSNGIPTEKVQPGSSKEIQILSSTINRMLETIKESQGTLIDINKTLETRINAAVEEIREKDDILHENIKQRAMDEMLINIAHQWRQPLNSATVAIQNIEDLLVECKDKEEIESLINIATKELMMLSEIITRFTKFYEQEASTLVDIQEGLNIFISLSETSLKTQNINIISSFDEDFNLISSTNEWVDLFSVFLKNLEEIKESRGLGEATLRVEGKTDSSTFVLSISDDAGGIDEDMLPSRLFEPYVTSYFKSNDKGLGLYTARHIVKYVFRGSLSAQNTESGARFIITIPKTTTITSDT